MSGLAGNRVDRALKAKELLPVLSMDQSGGDKLGFTLIHMEKKWGQEMSGDFGVGIEDENVSSFLFQGETNTDVVAGGKA